jgi:glycosyltransferase involved in cell wall biosynthesis
MVGPIVGVQEQLGLDEEPEFTDGIPDIDDYYRAITRLDVGIAPLADTGFNKAKSWLKPLELAACGVVPVMSPVAEYASLHSQGIGVLAQWKGRNWRQQVERLLLDENLRNELAWQAEGVVRTRHTIEGRCHLWAEAWERAFQNAASRRPSQVAA